MHLFNIQVNATMKQSYEKIKAAISWEKMIHTNCFRRATGEWLDNMKKFKKYKYIHATLFQQRIACFCYKSRTIIPWNTTNPRGTRQYTPSLFIWNSSYATITNPETRQEEFSNTVLHLNIAANFINHIKSHNCDTNLSFY